MKYKTKNKKTIEEIALDEYAWKVANKKLQNNSSFVAFLFSFIVYIYLYIYILLFFVSNVNNADVYLYLPLLIALLPALIVYFIIVLIFLFFSNLYCGKNKLKKIIEKLSFKEKNKIISVYIKTEMEKYEEEIDEN